MPKQKYYVVWKGKKTGIFTTWSECEAQVKGFTGAEFKAFETREEAERAFRSSYQGYVKASPAPGKTIPSIPGTPALAALPVLNPNLRRQMKLPIPESYCADASCIGNPGRLEYRCVHTTSRQMIFEEGPFERGTNNIGEFLAIVHALMLCAKTSLALPIYSDSENAIGWVRQKKCKTLLLPDARNKNLFTLIAEAETWLRSNHYPNPILKWETKVWGEIPADYGRK